MNRSDKRLKELDIILNRENVARVSEAIEVLRNSEPYEGAIGLLVALFGRSNNSLIKRQITGFMNDLKDQSASPEVMEEIRKGGSDETLRMLISSCWQSGLDYSDYLAEFAGIFMKTADYIIALECFSVIESSAWRLSDKSRGELIDILNIEGNPGNKDVMALRRELVSILG